jgi:hypothetical protein
MTIILTDLEQKALAALQQNSRDMTGSEMSFGVMEEVSWTGSRKQLGALVTTLQQKGIVEEVVKTKVDRNTTVTQFVLADAYRQ